MDYKALRLKRPFENPLSFFNELLIVQLVPRIFRPCQRQLFQIEQRETHGIVANLTDQPVPRPVFERALYVFLRHIQIPGHRGKRHARRRMITQHQRVEIDLHKIAGRAKHIFGDKHIFHGRGIKQRGAVIKRAKRHVSSPFAFLFNLSIVSHGGAAWQGAHTE